MINSVGEQGALVRQADLALANALAANRRAGNGRSETDILDSLLRLVTVDETGQPARLEVDYQHCPRRYGESWMPSSLAVFGARHHFGS